MSACPAEDELVRLVEGALGEASLVAIERHVDGCEACAAVVAGLGALAPRETAAARTVGRYQLDRRIAAGGMGEVWAGWDPELRREVAIKLVISDRTDGNETARLVREARALARLGHPNVLAVYDVGEHDGDVFLATELVAGDTLANRGGPGSEWRALVGMYVQAARGLAAAHAAGLVHRDVKPANLLVGGDGRVRVADFGLAVAPRTPTTATTAAPGGGDPVVTAPGAIAGTPAYMAPEQRAGRPLDARVDQYALCVALVESIVGRRPRAGLTQAELLAFVLERRAREPDLEALCGILARGLAVDPAARHASVGALADLLVGVAEPRPVQRGRRRGLAIALAGAAVVATGAAVYASRSGGDGERTVAAARAPEAPPDAPALKVIPDAAVVVTTSVPPVDARPPDRPPAPPPPPRAMASPPVAVVPPPAAPPDDELTIAENALRRHDARACRLVLGKQPVRLDDPRADDRLAQLRARCMMLGGDCEAGTQMFVERFRIPKAGAESVADMHCPPTGPPEVQLRRLVTQTTRMMPSMLDCPYFVEPVRAAARLATDDVTRRSVGSVMHTLARCFDARNECDAARALAGEAVRLIPQLAGATELRRCRN